MFPRKRTRDSKKDREYPKTEVPKRSTAIGDDSDDSYEDSQHQGPTWSAIKHAAGKATVKVGEATAKYLRDSQEEESKLDKR